MLAGEERISAMLDDGTARDHASSLFLFRRDSTRGLFEEVGYYCKEILFYFMYRILIISLVYKYLQVSHSLR